MTTTATPTNPVTESKFAALKAKLRELFELDKSDLDFGIYRIMAVMNKEVTDFLDRQLKDVVRETLTRHGVSAVAQVDAEIAEARRSAQDAGFNPDDSPKVKVLQAKRDSIGGGTAAELEADIYNHLLAFFSRYYDEGDFISKRRYKGDTYAIPYAGEEVVLHWANKEQYYIKSGEWHMDYRFKVGGKTTRVRLLQATQEASNNKEADDAKRRFILCADNPVDAAITEELILHFEFRAPTDDEKKAISESEATRIFGGKYDKSTGRTKGNEREQFTAYAETVALDAMPGNWKQLLSQLAPTDAKPNRTILGKHLDDFTAKNTFDYFIHKDLGGFLRRELDFYIKNEVVRLDDLEALDEGHLARVQGKIKAIRRVAGRIIDFLAALENFQKKLWLKKKLVLGTNWLVTIDRVPERLRDTVATCEEQWTEWESLGFKPEDDDATGVFSGVEWGTRAYIDAYDKLVVDTRLFDGSFRTELLASEEVLGRAETLEEATTGVLLNGDNFHALLLLATVLRQRVKHTYIDPPYNAKFSQVPYKNTFLHAAWMTMMADRLLAAQSLERGDAVLTVAIDENEQERLGYLLDTLYPTHDRTCVSVIHNHGGIQGTNFSYCHEYAYFVFPSGGQYIGTNDREEADIVPFRDWGGKESLRVAARNCFYPIFVSGEDVIGFGEVCDESFHPESAAVEQEDGTLAVYPVDANGNERKWRFARDTVERIKNELKCDVVNGERAVRRRKSAYRYKTVWTDKRYNANSHGSRVLANIMGNADFAFPKSIYNVSDCVHAVTQDQPGAIVLDFFAGSGTTGHAVIALNRRDSLGRRFVLVEMGEYFNTVLRPRIAKIIYSPDWKTGKAQNHDKGISALVKYFAIESYEDALNNLPAPNGDLLRGVDDETRDALISYALDLELGPHLLNLDAFRDPWDYTINAQPAGDDEIRPHPVDLIETFNYLLGLMVHAYGPIERYSAEFERASHDDNLGCLKVKGRLRRNPEGQFTFQRVEGVLNDSENTRVLVVWRKLTEDSEQDAAVLDAWMERHREDTKQRSEHRDYHQIYINGPVTLAQPTQEIRTVFPLEETFKNQMFADTEGA